MLFCTRVFCNPIREKSLRIDELDGVDFISYLFKMLKKMIFMF